MGWHARSASSRSIRCTGNVLIALAVLGATLLPASAASGSPASDPRHRYIVVLSEGDERPGDVARDHERRYGADVDNVYRHSLRGYAARLPDEAVAAVARDPRVAFVEADQTVESLAQQMPTGIRRIFAPTNAGIDIDGSDDVRVDVDVAIIDTGIDADHPDLNVVSSMDCTVSGSLNVCVEGSGKDDNGHGTHVAGTVGALDNDLGVAGVAPGARLHGLKALSATGDGLLSWAIAAVDWVTARADVIEVSNMSLGCNCSSTALDQAIASSVDAGVVHVVAAGNSDADAEGFSPASGPDVVTVSALADFDGVPGGGGAPTCRTDQDDTLADFSNWGSRIEVAAPGVCILSTWPFGGYRVISGTSMASPHVAGAAAILTSGANDPQDRADVSTVRAAIVRAGNFDWTDDSGDGFHEPLLDVGDADTFVVNSPTRTLGTQPSDPSTNDAPVASYTESCSGLSCSFDATASYDPDGTIASYAWDFGDGTRGSGATVDKTYNASGTYTVVLTVTDDDGAATATSRNVTVSSGGDGGGGKPIHLTGAAVRTGTTTTVSLYWRGTDVAGDVVVYRNGETIATTADDGSYTDVIENSSGNSYTYKICEEDTDRCSNEVTLF